MCLNTRGIPTFLCPKGGVVDPRGAPVGTRVGWIGTVPRSDTFVLNW